MGIWIGEHESAKFWLTVLNKLRNCGVQDILIASVNNLKGFTEAIPIKIFSETANQYKII